MANSKKKRAKPPPKLVTRGDRGKASITIIHREENSPKKRKK